VSPLRDSIEAAAAYAATGRRDAIDRLVQFLREETTLEGPGDPERAALRPIAVNGMVAAADYLGRADYLVLAEALAWPEAREAAAGVLEQAAGSGKMTVIMSLRQVVADGGPAAEQTAIVLAAAQARLNATDLRSIARQALRVDGEHRAWTLFDENLRLGDEASLEALRFVLRDRAKEADEGLERAKRNALLLIAQHPERLEAEDLDRLREGISTMGVAQRNKLFDAIGAAMNAADPAPGAARTFSDLLRDALRTEQGHSARNIKNIARKHVLAFFSGPADNPMILATMAANAVRWADEPKVAERALDCLAPAAFKGDLDAIDALTEAAVSTARHYPELGSYLAADLLSAVAGGGHAAAVVKALTSEIRRGGKRDDRASFVALGRAASHLTVGDGQRAEALEALRQALRRSNPRRAPAVESALCGLLALADDLAPAERTQLLEAFNRAVNPRAQPGEILDAETRVNLRKRLLGERITPPAPAVAAKPAGMRGASSLRGARGVRPRSLYRPSTPSVAIPSFEASQKETPEEPASPAPKKKKKKKKKVKRAKSETEDR